MGWCRLGSKRWALCTQRQTAQSCRDQHPASTSHALNMTQHVVVVRDISMVHESEQHVNICILPMLQPESQKRE